MQTKKKKKLTGQVVDAVLWGTKISQQQLNKQVI